MHEDVCTQDSFAGQMAFALKSFFFSLSFANCPSTNTTIFWVGNGKKM